MLEWGPRRRQLDEHLRYCHSACSATHRRQRRVAVLVVLDASNVESGQFHGRGHVLILPPLNIKSFMDPVAGH
jgi:hypothetical protein